MTILPIKDCSVLYSILLHTNTKKLELKSICVSLLHTNDVTKSKRHSLLWSNLINRLVNLEEIVLLTEFEHIEPDHLYRALGNTCKKLEVLQLKIYRCTDDLVMHLRDCKHLRTLKIALGPSSRNNVHMNDFIKAQMKKAIKTFPRLEELDFLDVDMLQYLDLKETTPLQLRTLNIGDCLPSEFSRVLLLCPHLQCLSVTLSGSEMSKEIFQLLANSSLKLVKLRVANFIYDTYFQCFLDSKGEFIEQLRITTRSQNDLYSAILEIGKCCINLSLLDIKDNRIIVDIGTSEPYPPPGSLFSSLESFTYTQNKDPRIPILCISQAKTLTVLSLGCKLFSKGDLITLLTPAKLSHITKICFYGMMSKEDLRHVYDNSPNLVYLYVGVEPSENVQDFLYYLFQLDSEIVENNLDIIFLCTT